MTPTETVRWFFFFIALVVVYVLIIKGICIDYEIEPVIKWIAITFVTAILVSVVYLVLAM